MSFRVDFNINKRKNDISNDIFVAFRTTKTITDEDEKERKNVSKTVKIFKRISELTFL